MSMIQKQVLQHMRFEDFANKRQTETDRDRDRDRGRDSDRDRDRREQGFRGKGTTT